MKLSRSWLVSVSQGYSPSMAPLEPGKLACRMASTVVPAFLKMW